jgi:hypothetical protein
VGKSGPWIERAAKVVDAIDTLVTAGSLEDAAEMTAALNAHGVFPARAHERCAHRGSGRR